jgi:hypothetical protein
MRILLVLVQRDDMTTSGQLRLPLPNNNGIKMSDRLPVYIQYAQYTERNGMHLYCLSAEIARGADRTLWKNEAYWMAGQARTMAKL